MRKAIVIGSGIAGIAAAIRMQLKDHQVTVFEANNYPGGKLSEISNNGFRFDAGPSLFTLPQYVDELFVLAGKNPKDYFDYIRIEKACDYFYEDGTHLAAWADPAAFAAEVETKTGISSEIITKKLELAANRYQKASRIFLENNLRDIKTWLSKDVVLALSQIHKLGIFGTMHTENKKELKDERLVKLFDRFATYNGSDPYRAPGILNSIPHLEHNIGTYFPKGGMHQITQSLYKLSLDIGVNYQFNTSVKKINVDRGSAKSIEIENEKYHADLILCNMDVFHAYHKLLPDQKAPRRILSQERSSSALIFYWGIRREFQNLGLHNIFFSQDYKEEFNHLFQKKEVYHDPTVYINISSKYEKSHAPEGCENWFVMINVPANYGQPWDTIIPEAKKSVLKKLSRMLHQDIASIIQTEDILDPRSIESKTSSHRGSLYGTSSNNQFAAFLRHPNQNSNLKNLYFCGGSVHPGGGIPLSLLSAKIATQMALNK
jgi:phytoene desaturase